jgi:H+/Cl- antiporter ClcA
MKRAQLFDWSKILYVAKGLLVGIVVGIVVSLFRMSIEFVLDHMRMVYDFLQVNPIWIVGWVFVILGMAFIVSILVRDEPNIQGSGIQDIEGQLHGVLKLNWWSIVWRKFIGGSLSIGSGLSLGREGPSIQVGGAVGQGINHFLKGNTTQENILISSGAAAGLSAAFNAPVSGVTFIMEEVHHKFSGAMLLTAFSASVMANFIAYSIFGVQPALDLGDLTQFPLHYYLLLIGMGLFLAVGGWFYQEVLLIMPKLYAKLPIPAYLNGFIPFLLLIPIGYFIPDMLGAGTGMTSLISETRTSTVILLIFFLYRFVFSHIAYGSGLPGGIFIPVLSLGALMGGIYGNGALWFTNIEEIFFRSFIIYAMGGFLTAVTKAPLTSVMLITELTGTVTHLMPLAVVCLTSYVGADFLGSEPIYEELLHKKIQGIPKVFEGVVKEIEVSVEPNSQLDGMMHRHLSLPYGAKLVRVRRHANEFIPHKDTVFWPGDELYITADSGFLSEVKKQLNRLNT